MKFLSRLFGGGETAAERQAWLDSTVKAAASGVHDRYLQSMRNAQRGFEAAETPAWTESWPTHAANINLDLSRQLPTMRSRARGLARNDEWATNYLIKLDDNVLGEQGIRLQMRVKLPDGSQDKKTNALLEGAWEWLGERIDVAGYSWRQVESLALGGLPPDGELLYRFRFGSGPMGFQIQLLDPALLDINLHRDWGGNRVRMGVEITDDGLPVAYWLRAERVGDVTSQDLTTVGKHVRVPADQMRHRFHVREVGQLRGYPWLSAGARRLWLLHDFEEAAAVASSNAAKRQGFFYTEDGEAPSGFGDTIVSSVLEAAKAAGKVLTAEEVQAITAAAEKFTTTMPGQFDTLPSNTRFEKFETAWPNVDANGYVKQQLRGWSAARGISYVSLGNDLESVNYSSAQVGIVAERDHYKAVQGMLKGWLHAEVFAAALPYLVLNTPGLKASRMAEYLAAATWQGRRWQPVDDLKKAKADETNLRLKLTSRRRLQVERGDDPDEIRAEIEEEEKLYGTLDQENMPRPTKDEEDDDEAATAKGKNLRLA
jgi:lambda family phage portal protein